MNKIISVRSAALWSPCFRPLSSIQDAKTDTRVYSAFDNKDSYPDITLHAGQTTLHAHRLILAKRNDFFKSMFQSKMTESTETQIKFDDVDPSAFAKFIQYLYQRELKVDSPEQAIAIAEMAHKYMEPKLAERLDDHLTRGLDSAALLKNDTALNALAQTLSPLRLPLPRLSNLVNFLTEPWKYPVNTFPESGPMWSKDGFKPTEVLKNTYFPIKVGDRIVSLLAYADEKEGKKTLSIEGLALDRGSHIPLQCKEAGRVNLVRTSSETHYVIQHKGEHDTFKMTRIGASSGQATEWEIPAWLEDLIVVRDPLTEEETIAGHTRTDLLFLKSELESKRLPLLPGHVIMNLFLTDQFPDRLFVIVRDEASGLNSIQSTDRHGEHIQNHGDGLEFFTPAAVSGLDRTHILGSKNPGIIYFETKLSSPSYIEALCSPLGETYFFLDRNDICKIPVSSETPPTPEKVASLPTEATQYRCVVSAEGNLYAVSNEWICIYSPATNTCVKSPRANDGTQVTRVSIIDGALMISDYGGNTTVYGPNPFDRELPG